MHYLSTRKKDVLVLAEEAIVRGICASGGLFVPKKIEILSLDTIESLMRMDYFERAAFILHKFLPDFDYDELLKFCDSVYSNDFGIDTTPIKVEDGVIFLELWHGKTLAFKDFALSVLPYLLKKSKEKLNDNRHSLILTATSGDTGVASLKGFGDWENMSVSVFYPSEGVSKLQRLQMTTCEHNNAFVFGVNGNFDDAQNAVKSVFSNDDFKAELEKKGITLTSANSINLGRLIPQIVYYFSSYVDLVTYNNLSFGEKVNFCVPSGNFGNVLAGYYAKKMGLPIGKLIVASNENSVLTDFIKTGCYDLRRKFFKTTSPSMDILISSNLERLIFELSGRDHDLTSTRMDALKTSGHYSITEDEHNTLCEDFEAEWSNNDEVFDAIESMYKTSKYLIDPHTAVALSGYRKYVQRTQDLTRTVVLSTASPFKFPSSVLKSIERDKSVAVDELENLQTLIRIKASELTRYEPSDYVSFLEQKKRHELQFSVATFLRRDDRMAQSFNLEPLLSLKDKPINHDRVIDKEEILSVLKDLNFKTLTR